MVPAAEPAGTVSACLPDLESGRRAFRALFGRPPEVAARAPGRVNLIGEHTDYEEGLVLPCAVERDALALAARRDDGRVRVRAHDLGDADEFDAARPARRGDWADYVRGVAWALAEGGAPPPGIDLWIASRVPRGSGLSSSAALGVAVATAWDAAAGPGLAPLERACIAHRAESVFAEVGCGVLDHFASALGRRGHALRIDCRSQEAVPVPLPPEDLALLVAHSGVTRRLAGGAYRDRVQECRRAFELAAREGVAPPDATALRDLAPADLPALERVLPPVLLRRARHVVSENARVDAFCDALSRGDREAAGALLAEGQRSLRDDFEVSVPELDALCEIAARLPGVVGSRLTGAGFGGCTLHLVEPDAAARAAQALADGFAERTGHRPWVLRTAAAEGAGPVALE